LTLLQGSIVVAASGAAGLVNAVAGGGTLLSFPALLATGFSPVAANVTSTVALWPGQLSSAWAYRRHVADERRRAIVLAVPSLLGGTIGSLLLLRLPEQSFAAVVPWLILFACVLLALQGPIKAVADRHAGASHPAIHWILQLLISVYGGYFGAGIGILMLAAMGILIRSSMQHANALKILFALLTNGTACLLFAFDGRVDWPVATVMALASLAGGLAGARLAQRLAPWAMRAFAIAVGLFAAGKILLGS
jgi:uncharacterized membrane protein YfcA